MCSVKKMTRAVLLLVSFVLTACGVGNEQTYIQAVEVNTKNLTSISIVSSNDRVREGETETFTALGNVDGGASQIDITSSVSWSSSDSSIISVNSNGVATGKSNGTADVIARLADLSATKALRSSDAPLVSIAVSNQPASLPVCQTSSQQLLARGTYSDGDEADISDKVSWSVSDSSVIYVGDVALSDGSREDKGVLSGLSIDDAQIIASQDDIDSEGVTVSVVAGGLTSISVSSADEMLYAEESSQFSALGDYGSDPVDITENVQWGSSDITILAFSDTDTGLAELLLEGSSNVSATCDPGGSGELQSALLAVDVEAAVEVVSLRVKYGNDSYNDDDTIELDLEDGEAQLKLYTVDTKGDEGIVDLADEEETSWSVIGTALSGEAADISSSGLVTFDAVGESEYQVRYKDDDNDINVDIYFFIKVE
ncbi:MULTISPECIES: Ig-like domain-containing protein [unclassified Oleiphilus]|jgi:hypothetical protein|uniref:Ig-like domain-containing protein n=6 Tax=Oleiphilus TaxID=141450 RepID=UPI0007C40CEC|nr:MULTISPECIES: Ig-like domain-containing protein [unclassified Oleiphilus]KZY48409.1 hypothetical protein A3732_05890 [Oleiphilus sp. HI0050]KZY83340.1 hypothetical protein A3741_00325 [Oleiphilus sp. HI0069]KZY93780.1 hypothetical protein A3743_06090 [Oleiphilus sp. HI0072]KZZ30595.1 hypothetical protein A3755_13605 [Oleiphilus sp. HI0085]KZY39166.1 hypothetical protein A3729_15450 [Oleiphilus sp. HI0043]